MQNVPRLEEIKVKFLYICSKNNTLIIIKYKAYIHSNESDRNNMTSKVQYMNLTCDHQSTPIYNVNRPIHCLGQIYMLSSKYNIYLYMIQQFLITKYGSSVRLRVRSEPLVLTQFVIMSQNYLLLWIRTQPIFYKF